MLSVALMAEAAELGSLRKLATGGHRCPDPAPGS